MAQAHPPAGRTEQGIATCIAPAQSWSAAVGLLVLGLYSPFAPTAPKWANHCRPRLRVFPAKSRYRPRWADSRRWLDEIAGSIPAGGTTKSLLRAISYRVARARNFRIGRNADTLPTRQDVMVGHRQRRPSTVPRGRRNDPLQRPSRLEQQFRPRATPSESVGADEAASPVLTVALTAAACPRIKDTSGTT
jgi:hypothetical protein